MLETLRNAAGTWVAKALLALLVVSFAVWGISGSIFGGLGNSVVTAGNTTVSVLEYRLAYDRQLSILSQQFGTRITREQAQERFRQAARDAPGTRLVLLASPDVPHREVVELLDLAREAGLSDVAMSARIHGDAATSIPAR